VKNRRTGILLTTALIGILAACSSGSPGKATPNPTSPTSTTAAPGSAKITTFTVPASVQCGAAPSITFSVGYAATGAKSLQLLVDGRDNPGLVATGGTIQVPVHCDAVAHTVVLVALDDKGGQTVQQKTLQTLLPS
jgi:hypothetical protein